MRTLRPTPSKVIPELHPVQQTSRPDQAMNEALILMSEALILMSEALILMSEVLILMSEALILMSEALILVSMADLPILPTPLLTVALIPRVVPILGEALRFSVALLSLERPSIVVLVAVAWEALVPR